MILKPTPTYPHEYAVDDIYMMLSQPCFIFFYNLPAGNQIDKLSLCFRFLFLLIVWALQICIVEQWRGRRCSGFCKLFTQPDGILLDDFLSPSSLLRFKIIFTLLLLLLLPTYFTFKSICESFHHKFTTWTLHFFIFQVYNQGTVESFSPYF